MALPDKHLVKARIEDIGIIPSVRAMSAGDARFAAGAISEAGIPLVEIATTVDGALAVIVDLVRSVPGLIVGADVLDVETARRAVGAGAGFITSPCLDRRVVEFARKENVLVIPGALTPTEVRAAWEAGADFVKVFPCAPLGGERYVRALKAPLNAIPLVASGGVNQQTVTDFVRAGAIAVGVGAALIPAKAIRHRRPDWIAELARRFLHLVHEARERVATANGKHDEYGDRA